MILARWASAVFTAIPRREATSLLDLPSARSCRISRSRGVRRMREGLVASAESGSSGRAAETRVEKYGL